MNDMDTTIKLNIKRSTRISYTTTADGRTGTTITSDETFMLTRGYQYRVPITNTFLKLDDHNVIKLNGKLAEKVTIFNVEDGVAVISPVIHGTVLKDGDVIGKMI